MIEYNYICLIGAYRKEYTDMNQREFGIMWGVSQQTMSSWETSRSYPPYPIARAIADYFNLERVDDLYQKAKVK